MGLRFLQNQTCQIVQVIDLIFLRVVLPLTELNPERGSLRFRAVSGHQTVDLSLRVLLFFAYLDLDFCAENQGCSIGCFPLFNPFLW